MSDILTTALLSLGLSNGIAPLVAVCLHWLAILIASVSVALFIRIGIRAAGFRGPTPARPGLDWARLAGFLTTIVAGYWALSATMSLPVPSLGSKAWIAPLMGAMLVLAMGDHFARLAWEGADAARKEERDAYEDRARAFERWSPLAAVGVLMGQHIWEAWPLAAVVFAIWGYQQPTIRATTDQWISDVAAGYRLRRQHGLTEGAPVEYPTGNGILAGPVGLVDSRVKSDDAVYLLRNHLLVPAPTPTASPKTE